MSWVLGQAISEMLWKQQQVLLQEQGLCRWTAAA
jgi:hypothetical protein